MAKAVGIGPSSVQRIWAKHGLKPHLVSTFKVSNDPKLAEKVADVIGLYMNPPDKALVYSMDEKSQIQALDRTQPGLPMKKACLSGYHPHPLYVVCLLGLQARAGAGALRRRSG